MRGTDDDAVTMAWRALRSNATTASTASTAPPDLTLEDIQAALDGLSMTPMRPEPIVMSVQEFERLREHIPVQRPESSLPNFLGRLWGVDIVANPLIPEGCVLPIDWRGDE